MPLIVKAECGILQMELTNAIPVDYGNSSYHTMAVPSNRSLWAVDRHPPHQAHLRGGEGETSARISLSHKLFNRFE